MISAGKLNALCTILFIDYYLALMRIKKIETLSIPQFLNSHTQNAYSTLDWKRKSSKPPPLVTCIIGWVYVNTINPAFILW